MATDDDIQPKPSATLADRLDRIDKLEREIIRKSGPLLSATGSLSHADFFVIGAVRRTLAQARGFRDLIGSRNFPCAAAILRLQIDTAMRINALFLVDDMVAACKAVLDGGRFNKLKATDGSRLTDLYLRAQLAEQNPWIEKVYEQTSDFVHLSGRHFYSSIVRTEESTRTAHFMISGHDPARPEDVYFEIADTFFEATKLVGTMVLAYFSLRSGTIKFEPEEG